MPKIWLAHLGLLFVQLTFGCLPAMGKYVMTVLEPRALVLLRVLGAAVLLGIVRYLYRLPAVRERSDRYLMVGLAVFGVVLNQALYLEGLSRSTAVNAAVLATAIPVISTLMAILFRQERSTWLKLLGIGVSLSGALLLVGIDRLDFGNQYLVGNLLLLGNSFSYSLYLVLSKPVLERNAALSVVAGMFGLSVVGLLPFSAPALYHLDFGVIPPAIWGMVAGIVLFPTVLAYLLNSWALKYTTASVVVVYIYLQPVVATLLGVGLLGEALTTRTVASAALIFAGLFCVIRARRGELRQSASPLTPPIAASSGAR